MREDTLNEFELQEKESTKVVVAQRVDEIKRKLNFDKEQDDVTESGEVLNRLDSLEHNALNFPSALTPLTPSDDLEAVKAMLNQIIEVINKD